MIEIIKNKDYKDFLSLLIQQYKEKPKFKEVLETVGNQMNNLEDASFEIRNEFYLDSAVGVQLDIIGKIIGLDRAGRDDESYRTLLKVKADLNFSSGTPESIIKTATSLYNATIVEYIPRYPAKIQLWTDGDIGLYLTFQMELDDTGLMELDDGGILELLQPDDIAEDLLFQILPSGVGLLIADNLILDDDEFLYLDLGDHLILT